MIGWKRCCAALALGSLGIAALAGRPWVTAGDLPPEEPQVVVESATAEGGCCKSCGKFCGSCAKNGKRFLDCLFGCGMKCDNPPRRYYRVVAGNPTMDVTYMPGGSVIESANPDAHAPAGVAVPPGHARKQAPESLPPQPPHKEIFELPSSSVVAENPVGKRLNKLGATYQLEAPRHARPMPHHVDESVATKLKTFKIPSLEFKGGKRAEEYAKSKPVEQPAEPAPSKEEKAAAVARDYRPLSPPKAAVAGGAPAVQGGVAVQGYKRTGQKVLPLDQYPVAKSGPKLAVEANGNVATVAKKPSAKASSAPTQVVTKATVAPKAMAQSPDQTNPAPKATATVPTFPPRTNLVSSAAKTSARPTAPVLVTAKKATASTAPSYGVSGSVTQAAASAKPNSGVSPVKPATARMPAGPGVASSPVKPATAPTSASPSVNSATVKPAFATTPSTTTGIRRTAPAASSTPPSRPKEFVSRTFSRKREAATSAPPASPTRSSAVVKVGPPPAAKFGTTPVAAHSSPRPATLPQAKAEAPGANPWSSKSGVAPPKVAIGQRAAEASAAPAVATHEIPGPVVRAAIVPSGGPAGSVNTVSHETNDQQRETVKRPFWKKGWEAVKELSKPGW